MRWNATFTSIASPVGPHPFTSKPVCKPDHSIHVRSASAEAGTKTPEDTPAEAAMRLREGGCFNPRVRPDVRRVSTLPPPRPTRKIESGMTVPQPPHATTAQRNIEVRGPLAGTPQRFKGHNTKNKI